MNSTFQKYYLNYADVHSYELKINVITHQNKLFYLTLIKSCKHMNDQAKSLWEKWNSK